MNIVLWRLETLKALPGIYEKQLLEEVDFSEDHPKLVLKQGVIDLRNLPGHIVCATRSAAVEAEDDLRNIAALTRYIKNFKMWSCSKLQEEIKKCLSQDSLANAFGCLDILCLLTMMEANKCFEHNYGKDEIKVLGNHFGNKFWVLKFQGFQQ